MCFAMSAVCSGPTSSWSFCSMSGCSANSAMCSPKPDVATVFAAGCLRFLGPKMLISRTSSDNATTTTGVLQPEGLWSGSKAAGAGLGQGGVSDSCAPIMVRSGGRATSQLMAAPIACDSAVWREPSRFGFGLGEGLWSFWSLSF